MSSITTVQLGTLLTKAQLTKVLQLVNAADTVELRAYLNSIGDELSVKGVLADYLYYWMVHQFNLDA